MNVSGLFCFLLYFRSSKAIWLVIVLGVHWRNTLGQNVNSWNMMCYLRLLIYLKIGLWKIACSFHFNVSLCQNMLDNSEWMVVFHVFFCYFVLPSNGVLCQGDFMDMTCIDFVSINGICWCNLMQPQNWSRMP